MRRSFPFFLLSLALAGCGGDSGGHTPSVGAAGKATFESLPTGLQAKAVSEDGAVVVGNSDGGSSNTPLFWRRTGGAVTFPVFVQPHLKFAEAVSADGGLFAGEAVEASDNLVPVLATPQGALTPLALPAGNATGFVVGLSGDGSVALCTDLPQTSPYSPKPYLVRDGVATSLPLPGGFTTADVRAISSDGTTVVGALGGAYSGSHGNKPVRWVAGGAPEALSDEYGMATAVSRDGSVVVGLLYDEAGGWVPFRWTAATGAQRLPVPTPGYAEIEADGVSADGATVLLNAVDLSQGSRPTVFLWTPSAGLRSLLDVFVSAGGDASTFKGTEATAISSNGKVVVGNGAWRLTLP